MNDLVRFTSKDLAAPRTRGLAARRRPKGLSPVLEGLEERVVLSTIQWNTTVAPNGGDWDKPINWQGGVVPGASDTAVIEYTRGPVYHSTSASDSILALQIVSGDPTVSVNNGSLAIGSAPSTIDGTLSVSGTGTLRFSNSTVNGGGTLIDGNKLTASNSTFALTNGGGITLTSGSTVKSGDLTNNVFNTTLTVPITDVPLLPDNQSFKEVNLSGGLDQRPVGDSDPIGTQTGSDSTTSCRTAWERLDGQTLTIDTGAIGHHRRLPDSLRQRAVRRHRRLGGNRQERRLLRHHGDRRQQWRDDDRQRLFFLQPRRSGNNNTYLRSDRRPPHRQQQHFRARQPLPQRRQRHQQRRPVQ